MKILTKLIAGRDSGSMDSSYIKMGGKELRTVKKVSDLTGISVRTLHYYDEIGLLKPSGITESGYRLYDDRALEVLQQILFFKELDIPLKEIKEILESPHFDKTQALKNHKKLLVLKRNRLNDLIELVDETLKGANTLSFKEFDMSEYFDALEDFKDNHSEEVTKYWGSLDNFNEFLENTKSKETEVASMAIKQYGSIEKYTEAMKKNLNNFSATMEQMEEVKDHMDVYKKKSEELFQKLTIDLTKEPDSAEIQQVIEEIVLMVNTMNQNIDMGENYWGLMAEWYATSDVMIEVTDKLYGAGASKFIGAALQFYLKQQEVAAS